MPTFSIVIPLFNKAPFVCKTVDSILNQTFSDFEIIIVDDGSTDNSAQIIEERYNINNVKVIKKTNGGPSSARNVGVQKAIGEWIIFLDADDLLLPNALSVFSSLISKYAGIDYFVCNYYLATKGIAKLFTWKKHDGRVNKPFFLEAIRELTDRPGSSAIKRTLLLEHPFNEKYRRFEDAESQYEIMRSNVVYQCSIPVMISNRDAGSASFYRNDIKEDFVGGLNFTNKSFWEQVTLFHLALDCKHGYPYEATRLYKQIYRRVDLKFTYYLIRVYWIFLRVWGKVFRKNKKMNIDKLLGNTCYENK